MQNKIMKTARVYGFVRMILCRFGPVGRIPIRIGIPSREAEAMTLRDVRAGMQSRVRAGPKYRELFVQS
ncbi:MAG TPA: hypothetical protein VFE62_19630 [Gemmataceae bacterium]|nr:hypothetical protein [Gemmataceae bacterium]